MACPKFHSLEVAFYKILRCSHWNLSCCSHKVLTRKTASAFNAFGVEDCCNLIYSLLVQHAFLSAASYPWWFLGYNCPFGFRHVKSYTVTKTTYALAGLIKEIRNYYLCIPGFECSELEQIIFVASTF